jgi:hypothetical protein
LITYLTTEAKSAVTLKFRAVCGARSALEFAPSGSVRQGYYVDHLDQVSNIDGLATWLRARPLRINRVTSTVARPFPVYLD